MQGADHGHDAEQQHDGPGQEHVLGNQRSQQQRADRRQTEHERDDDAAGDDVGQGVPDRAGERVESDPHRVLPDGPPLGETLGAGRHDVRLAQLVEQVGAHDADRLGHAGDAENDRRHRQVFEHVGQLRPAPGRVDILRGEEPADVGVEVDEAEVEDQQTEQEAGDRQSQEAEQRKQVVQRRVGPHGGVDANRQRDDPGQDDGGDRDDHRQPETVADDLGDGPLPLHGHPQVAARHQAHPAQVLDIHRLDRARTRRATAAPDRPRCRCPRRKDCAI